MGVMCRIRVVSDVSSLGPSLSIFVWSSLHDVTQLCKYPWRCCCSNAL